jgi:dTMP kinase
MQEFKPLFIVFDGIDGCGKTTQLKLFSNFLSELGADNTIVRFPGGTGFGNTIRDMLLRKVFNQAGEALAFALDRHHTLNKIVRPALLENKFVLADRYDSSSLAYQGVDITNDLNKAGEISEADLYIIFRMDPKLALDRAQQREALNELEKDVFTNRVEKISKVYNNLPRKNVIYIDVDEFKTAEDIQFEVAIKFTDFYSKINK